MKQTISFTQEVEILNQELVSTSIIAAVKINNNNGSMECVCEVLSDELHKNSEAEGDRAYGLVTRFAVEHDIHWTSKTLDYWVKVEKTPEEITLTLMRNKYKY